MNLFSFLLSETLDIGGEIDVKYPYTWIAIELKTKSLKKMIIRLPITKIILQLVSTLGR